MPALGLLTRRLLTGMLAAVLGLLLLAPATPSAATPGATAPTDEAGFLALLNIARVSAGLPALLPDMPLANTSRTWSAHMGSRNQLYHDPNLAAAASRVEPRWRSIGENVGVGYSVQSLHDAFMASPAHRANIMSGKFNRVGVGVAHAGGRIWVTVRFLEGPTISVSPAALPVPTPPGVRTVLTGDFDGDGIGDALTYGPGAEADQLWFGRRDRTMWQVPVTVNGQYRPTAGDFDGDGRTEILWYAPGAAADSSWEWNGNGWTTRERVIQGTYTPLAGDFDRDGVDDILWYGPGGAPDHYWFGTRTGAFAPLPTTVAGTFVPVVGDFNGDDGDDVLWYGRGTAADVVWYSTGTRGSHRSARTSIGGSHTPFAGDFDGNGTDDIFLYTRGTPPDHQWFNTAGRFAATKVVRAVNGTYIPGATDFDGNSAADVLWFSPTSANGDPLWWGTPGTERHTGSTLRPHSS